jgi:hypothetical protein
VTRGVRGVWGIALASLACLCAGALGGCISETPYVANAAYKPPPPQPGTSKPKSSSHCYATVRSVLDKRSDPSTFGAVQGREVRPPADIVAWIGTALQGIDQYGINTGVPAEGNIAATEIQADLVMAWVSNVRVSKTANMVLSVRYRRGGANSDPKLYRGATNTVNWSSNDGELQAMIDRTMAQIIKSMAADMLAACKAGA